MYLLPYPLVMSYLRYSFPQIYEEPLVLKPTRGTQERYETAAQGNAVFQIYERQKASQALERSRTIFPGLIPYLVLTDALGLLTSCKEVYEESVEVFFQKNLFGIAITSDAQKMLLDEIRTPYLASTTHIRVNGLRNLWESGHGDFQGSYVNSLKDGQIRQIRHVRIFSKIPGHVLDPDCAASEVRAIAGLTKFSNTVNEHGLTFRSLYVQYHSLYEGELDAVRAPLERFLSYSADHQCTPASEQLQRPRDINIWAFFQNRGRDLLTPHNISTILRPAQHLNALRLLRQRIHDVRITGDVSNKLGDALISHLLRSDARSLIPFERRKTERDLAMTNESHEHPWLDLLRTAAKELRLNGWVHYKIAALETGPVLAPGVYPSVSWQIPTWREDVDSWGEQLRADDGDVADVACDLFLEWLAERLPAWNR